MVVPVNASYRIGLSIVSVTLILSSALCIAVVDPSPEIGPAGEHLGSLNRQLGPFRLTERSGRAVTDADLAPRVWIAAFVFSRCPSSCPLISLVMKDLQSRLTGTEVRLASITVDPEFDTPSVLQQFANRYSADPRRWLFLTGPKDDLYRLILDRFQIDVAQTTASDRKEGAEAIAHSDRLVLVGPGNRLLGAYDSKDRKAVGRLDEAARSLDRRTRADRMGWVLRLPAVNASLNASCAVLLMAGWLLVRTGRRRAHAACMTMAITVSALFLSCYLVYHYFVGSVPFRGEGPIRVAYLAILLSHTLLAITVVPLIIVTVIRAWRGHFSEHASLARVTFPIWFYVSITGVVVYWMLYQMPVPRPFSV
ncbi:MAG: putative rane protein [Planctomycetota bacterium]|nr:putative rane protein [Planctomycetota bacterium]